MLFVHTSAPRLSDRALHRIGVRGKGDLAIRAGRQGRANPLPEALDVGGRQRRYRV